MVYQTNEQSRGVPAAIRALERRKVRDLENAAQFRAAATQQLAEFDGRGPNGVREISHIGQAQHQDRELRSLRAIGTLPFGVMMEVEVEDRAGNTKKWLWYGSEGIELNMPLRASVMPAANGVAILAWTHPGLQAALGESLGESGDLWNSGLKIVAVTPEARGRFQQVLPDLVGLYEPGGSVGRQAEVSKERRTVGLKSVKLGMTAEQVKAFIGPMSGILLVTGAPGSGKTTVAMQRIRYLLDQQDQRAEQAAGVKYAIDETKIFLANRNLIHHTRNLLREELGIPDRVVLMVPDFIEAYVSDAWEYPLGARPSAKKHRPIELRAREALFSRCDGSDLRKGWKAYQRQIAKRLVEKRPMTWIAASQSPAHAESLVDEIKAYVGAAPGTDSRPAESYFAMGRLYWQVGATYEKLRTSHPSGHRREEFEERFAKWLYHVYDPIDCLRSVLEESRSRVRNRIERATAGRADGSRTIKEVVGELSERIYGSESLGWIALLLRFALPTESDPGKRFRRVPYAFATLGSVPTHVVIDEAQDLSAPEAAFLASLAHERGALTVSADFRQRVSPSKGIGDVEAIQIGALVPSDRINEGFRFTKNMRQSLELTRFLRAYYEVAFGEVPHFEADEAAERTAKPQLLIGNDSQLAQRVKVLRNVLTRAGSAGTVAVLQVNTDPAQRDWARRVLQGLDIQIMDGAGLPRGGAWTLANVEEIKGLEYDTCVVLGLDDIDAAELDNFKNRAYVAISRPTRRLLMLCNEFPSVLRGIPDVLYDRANA